MYENCVRACKLLECETLEAKVTRAKALFHLYTCNQLLLRQKGDFMSPKEFHTRHKDCYTMTKEVITSLGEALDDTSFVLASDAFRMLLIAMQDYMLETNQLHETNRCLLCLVKQSYSKFSSEVELTRAVNSITVGVSKCFDLGSKSRHATSSGSSSSSCKLAPSEGGPSSPQCVDKSCDLQSSATTSLRASHVFPNFILSRLAEAVPASYGARICHWDVYGAGQLKKKSQLLAPGACTLYMLCGKCEGILSSYGEAQFVRSFFDRIYDVTNPSMPKEAQSISYGPWLYLFCIGLIFRTLYIHPDEVLNFDELYRLLCKCRECLLNVHCVESILARPDVYLMISPTEDHTDQSGLINMLLTGSCVAYLGRFSLDVSIEFVLSQQQLSFAHFFLIHFGVFNILVKFSHSEAVKIERSFQVLASGGVYSVPANSERKHLLPKGVWTAFQFLSNEKEQDWLESAEKTYIPVDVQKEAAAKTFGILDNQEFDEGRLLRGILPSLAGSPFEVSILPTGFQVNVSNQQCPLVLPPDHSVLLHHTHGNTQASVTVLLCVGRSGAYSPSKPYIIYCTCQPNLVFCTGFFISAIDLTPTAFLPDAKGKTKFKDPQAILQAYAKPASIVTRCCMEEKGCHSFESLLHRLSALGLVIISIVLNMKTASRF